MKSALKFGLTSLGLILILIGVGGLVVGKQSERFVTKFITEIMSDAFSSAAHIDHVSIDPANRALVIHEFSLENPTSFKDESAFFSETINVKLDLETIFSKSPVIESLEIQGAVFRYRVEIPDGSNIGTLAKQLEAGKTKESKQFIVKELKCADAQIEFSTNMMPKAHMDLNLVTVDLKDLDNQKPVTTGQITSLFFKSVIKETVTLKGLLNPLINTLKKESKTEPAIIPPELETVD
jgi:hypothetical protein